jgi:hypothetical protein
VKRVVARTGIGVVDLSAHSLRAGTMTAADLLGIPMEKAMEHGRWKSYAAARIYRRHESLWVGNFSGRLLAEKWAGRRPSMAGSSPLRSFSGRSAARKRTSASSLLTPIPSPGI